MNNNRKIVITGASGFLGSHLVKRLKDYLDLDVYALSSRPNDLKEQLRGGNIFYCYKDALSIGVLKDAIIVNCAYPKNTAKIEVANGLKYIQRVFESAVDNGAAAIINISSQSVYSQLRTDVATEETPVCLESSYAVGKYAVELMLESICKKSETKYTNLRMASLIGPGFNQRIVNRFATQMLRHEQITVIKQDKYLGFLDVCDAVEAILSLIKAPDISWKPVYNVGNAKGYTVEYIYEVLSSILSKVTEINKPITETGSEISTTAVSYGQLYADTGFEPKIDLKESIVRILAQLN